MSFRFDAGNPQIIIGTDFSKWKIVGVASDSAQPNRLWLTLERVEE